MFEIDDLADPSARTTESCEAKEVIGIECLRWKEVSIIANAEHPESIKTGTEIEVVEVAAVRSGITRVACKTILSFDKETESRES
jgi:hypothetical protein